MCVGRRARGSESEGRGRGERSFHIFWFQLSAAATVKQKRRLSGENGDRIDVAFEAVCWGNFAKLEVWNDLSSKIWPDEQLETAQLEVSRYEVIVLECLRVTIQVEIFFFHQRI